MTNQKNLCEFIDENSKYFAEEKCRMYDLLSEESKERYCHTQRGRCDYRICKMILKMREETDSIGLNNIKRTEDLVSTLWSDFP